jgi:hypothetical protein
MGPEECVLLLGLVLSLALVLVPSRPLALVTPRYSNLNEIKETMTQLANGGPPITS